MSASRRSSPNRSGAFDTSSSGMTEKERRQELYKKLEKETEAFLASRKPAKYQEGWDEQSWEQEMAAHPLFAQQLPGGGTGSELPPLLEALRQVKYDETDNSPEELARSYKDDGNHLFKEQQYRAAVASYSEGIRQKTLNTELNAQLHLNRAAAQYHLNNFNAALEDCILALQFKPNYIKAMLRAAQSCWQLRKLDECDEFCIQLEKTEGTKDVASAALKEARELTDCVDKERKILERNRRKWEKELRERRQKAEELADAIKKAGVTLVPTAEDGELLPNLTPRFPALRNFAVSLENDADGSGHKSLIWPVALVYPELKETDFVQRWSEQTTFSTMLSAMYQGCPAERPVIGDEENNTVILYDPAELQVWYKSSKNDKSIAVRGKSTLRQILAQKDCAVEDGVPSFWVTRRGSEAEKELLSKQGI
ncbi:tetratricopeptide repeat protein 4-like [Tropilaelaps mercedesae]|uniref:Tetratricopeptide repeat protein 4-like n=1 Tax=Tropilaelaps mercedesae TaxID=418985 RepID=A0A1V9XS30_9ACAR|nr:tetratricopeptide repeat protein 4-like [Tropilaelaps mercedesae]